MGGARRIKGVYFLGFQNWTPNQNAGEGFLQVPLIGSGAEQALPVCLKILPHSLGFFKRVEMFANFMSCSILS